MFKILGFLTFVAAAIFFYGAVEWNSIVIHPEKGLVALGVVAAAGYKVIESILSNNT